MVAQITTTRLAPIIMTVMIEPLAKPTRLRGSVRMAPACGMDQPHAHPMPPPARQNAATVKLSFHQRVASAAPCKINAISTSGVTPVLVDIFAAIALAATTLTLRYKKKRPA